jgi:hypothetical protein
MKFSLLLSVLLGCLSKSMVNGQNNNPISLCKFLNPTKSDLKRCEHGQHLPGGPFYGEPKLSLTCFCLTTQYGLLYLADQATRIRMINSLGASR